LELERGALLELGVTQGSIICFKGDVFLVISQDCDISAVACSDPVVELIPLRTNEKQLTNGTREGRDPRTWQFELNDILYTAHAFDLILTPKSDFYSRISKESPQFFYINVSQLKRLKSWRTFRYSRTAWPNEFIERLDKNKNKLEDVLVKGAPTIRSLLVKLNTYEDLPDGIDYEVDVQLIFFEDPFSFDFEIKIQMAVRMMRVISRFQSSPGILVNSFTDTLQVGVREYEKIFSRQRPDINELLKDTEKLSQFTEQILRSGKAEHFEDELAIYMLGSDQIKLKDYDSFCEFTDDWMSYKGEQKAAHKG